MNTPTLQIDRIPELLPSEKLIEDLTEEIVKSRFGLPSRRHLLASLSERVGELAKAMLDAEEPDRVRSEALQVACVALRIAEEGDADYPELEMGKDSTLGVEQANVAGELFADYDQRSVAAITDWIATMQPKPASSEVPKPITRRYQVSYYVFGELDRLMRDAAIKFEIIESSPGARVHNIEVTNPPRETEWFWNERSGCAAKLSFSDEIVISKDREITSAGQLLYLKQAPSIHRDNVGWSLLTPAAKQIWEVKAGS
jgi:hypothetical protein